MRCKTHPEYAAKRKPACLCETCWEVWMFKELRLDKRVEIFRVLRYVGTPEFVAKNITNRGVKGRFTPGNGKRPQRFDGCFIEEAFLGEVPIEIEAIQEKNHGKS